jgi:hypothetical protein
MNRKHILIAVACTFLLASCDYQRNNKIKQKDVAEGDAYVYGVHPDSAARQAKNKYKAKPENEVKAAKIREKLFGPTGAIAEGN